MTNSTSYRTYYLRVNTQPEEIYELPVQPGYIQRITDVLQIKWPEYTAHILVWAFLYFLPSLSFAAGNLNFSVEEAGSINYMVSFTFLVGFSYLNYYRLVPELYLQKRFFAYFVFTAICFSILVAIRYLSMFDSGNISAPAVIYSFFSPLDYIEVLFILSTLIAIIRQQNLAIAKTEKDMEKIKMKSLNAQINPHFLFNSLNWIYSLAIQEATQTPHAVIQLSGLMRYLIKDAHTNFVSLENELNYIRNYLFLQEGRLGNTISLNCSVPKYNGPLTIAPLIAMSLIENAFKYGVNPDEDSVINIDISLTGNKFSLQIINNKVAVMKAAGDGVGIENTRQRLQLLYPNQHELEILDNHKIYSVTLSILLK